MSTHSLSATTIDLDGAAAGTTRLHLDGLTSGERGTESVTAHYRGDADATVALYVCAAHAADGGDFAQRVRIGVFERSRDLLPFPVFTGTLADLAERDRFERGVGRWTGRGDGADHEVTYEITWRAPADATGLDDRGADLGLVLEARPEPAPGSGPGDPLGDLPGPAVVGLPGG
ncbi:MULTISPECIES: hypothetical protein [Thermomonosporaceae]|uniref:hypothetical protein n=1 Tax=Thermomonosporaceae TaxID=2012 RepID=UPI00255B121C|nr:MULTISPECIES: hypothetical protein [Thermomonosporaceae]MDL4775946.1 hypothetical protein [Actinomadura xylanilytica]